MKYIERYWIGCKIKKVNYGGSLYIPIFDIPWFKKVDRDAFGWRYFSQRKRLGISIHICEIKWDLLRWFKKFFGRKK